MRPSVIYGRMSAYLLAMIGFLTLAVPRLAAQQAGAAIADIILHNGKILTVDPQFSTAQAVAIEGQKIAAVGDDQKILAMAGPNTLKIDLKGRTVVPGLIDTHDHIHDQAQGAYGGTLTPEQKKKFEVDWRGVTSKEDALNQVKGLMDRYHFKPGEWIYFANQLGFNGDAGKAEAKILYDDLNRWELAKVTPNNPAVMSLGIPDFNGFLVNDKGMEILLRDHEDYIKKYGRYWIDSTGRMDGHMEPPASRLLFDYLPWPAPEDLAPLYKQYDDELNAAGLTTVSTRLPKSSVETYKLLDSRGELTLRMAYGVEWAFGGGDVPDANNLKKFQNTVGSGTDSIWITSVAPTEMDGATTRACTNQKRQTAYGAIDSYWPTGQCQTDSEFKGAAGHAATIHASYYRDWIFASGKYGVRFANTHVAGDRSVRNMLDMIEQIQKQDGADATKGWAMDHCFLVNPADMPMAARLKVTFSCAPKYIETAAGVAKSYGDSVANTFMLPVKTMLDDGVRVVFESDRDTYTWKDLEMLLTRKDANGKVWGPQERLDKPNALKMITRWASEYVLKPDKIGSIEPGKLADLVVLDKDYLTIPAEQVHEIRPQLTMLGGKVIYLHPDFAQEYNLKPSGAVIASQEDLRKRRSGRVGPNF